VTQSIGRIARVAEGKQDAVCYDYVDDIQFCENQWKKRKTSIGKRGAGSLNGKEIDQQVTAIYNDCWKLYREYTKTHDSGSKGEIS